MGPGAEEFVFTEWRPRRHGAAPSFVASLVLHSALAAVMWNFPGGSTARSFPQPAVDEVLEKEGKRIVWYTPKETPLPEVAPAEPAPKPAEADTPRFFLPQSVAADQPRPQSVKQIVQTDAPEIAIHRDLDLPNIISWNAPKVDPLRYEVRPGAVTAPSTAGLPPLEPPNIEPEAPNPTAVPADEPRLRYWIGEDRPAPAPELATLAAEPAPEIARAGAAAELSPELLPEVARLRYQAAQERSPAPERRALDAVDAPAFSGSSSEPGLDASRFQQLPRLRYEARERRSAPAPERRALASEAEPAPEFGGPGAAPAVDASRFQQLSRLRYLQQEKAASEAAPQQRALAEVAEAAPGAATLAGTSPAVLPEFAPAPAVAPPASSGERNLIVVGVDPSERPPAELPVGSRRGRFAAGPDAVSEGGQTAAQPNESAAVRIPDLSVRDRRPPLEGERAGGPAGDPLDRFLRRSSAEDLAMLPPSAVAAERDEPSVDFENPFAGRAAYTLAINMPNITSYRGDWVIQYAELRERGSSAPEDGVEQRVANEPDKSLSPPWPRQKADPKYVAEAVREGVEGEVVFYAVIRENGALSDVKLLRSLDPRLDATAREALAKWVFEPARKYGLPVAVETVIRVPFRLNPALRMRY